MGGGVSEQANFGWMGERVSGWVDGWVGGLVGWWVKG